MTKVNKIIIINDNETMLKILNDIFNDNNNDICIYDNDRLCNNCKDCL